MLGTYVLSAGYYDAYYKKAMQVRTLILQDFAKAFKEVDVLLSPVSPTLPWKLGAKMDDPLAMYLSDVFTVTANIAGIPGLSVPAGFVDEQHGAAFLRTCPAIAPGRKGENCRHEIASGRRQAILVAYRPALIRPSLDDAAGGQRSQTPGQ